MSEKYHQIPDFIAFEDRLDNSLQRDIIKIEHVRMRIAHEQINSDIVDMELIELKFIFDRGMFLAYSGGKKAYKSLFVKLISTTEILTSFQTTNLDLNLPSTHRQPFSIKIQVFVANDTLSMFLC
jgi:hypothetical protein